MTGTWLFIGFISGWAWGLLFFWLQSRRADRLHQHRLHQQQRQQRQP